MKGVQKIVLKGNNNLPEKLDSETFRSRKTLPYQANGKSSQLLKKINETPSNATDRIPRNRNSEKITFLIDTFRHF